MAQIENFTYNESVEIQLVANTDNLQVNSNNINISSSSDIDLTGIDASAVRTQFDEGAVGLFFIRNIGNFVVTLKAKSLLSNYENRFQMDFDIKVHAGEVAVFLINSEGLFSYGVLLSNNKYYYMVRNANAADVTAAESIIYDSTPIVGGFGLNYKCLQFSAPHTFAGTEMWVQEMTATDVELNVYNPVFFNLGPIDPYEIGRAMADAARNNVKYIQDCLVETFAGHFFKNALVWTGTQKTAMTLYANKFKNYGEVGNIGMVRGIAIADKAIIDSPAIVTVYDSYTGITHNVDVLTSAMLQHLIDILNIYKKKYPDGTV